jgi:hypothetical protein
VRKKLILFLVVFAFIVSNVSFVYAKGSSHSSVSKGSSGSRSYSGSSSSSKKGSSSGSGYSGSSSSNKSSSSGSGYSGSSSSGSKSSGSSSRSMPSGSSSSSNSKTKTAKTTYMENTFKKQFSSSNYKSYNQTLNSEQKRVYDSSMSRGYSRSKMDFDQMTRTRSSRVSYYSKRSIYVNINTGHFPGFMSYGSAYVGIWDLWFLMRASDLFWYHHWNEIYPYRDYFEAAQFASMERRIRELETKSIARDSNYLEEGVDTDLQYSKEYQEKNMDSMYYTNKNVSNGANPIVVILIILGIILLLIIIIRKVSRPKIKRRRFSSDIY